MKYLLLFVLLLTPGYAFAQAALQTAETQAATAATAKRIYAQPTPKNLIRAMLRAGALDVTHPDVLNDYALLNECELFIQNVNDDFRMQRFRTAIGKVIAQDRAGWPDAFSFVSPLQLDKYDFTSQNFMLVPKAQIKNVNSFHLMDTRAEVCQRGQYLKKFPLDVSVRVDQPLTVTGLPLSEAAGNALLQSMLKSGNTARQIYGRFNIAVSFMSRYEVTSERGANTAKYVFDGSLASIEFFEDEAMTKPIWVFTKN